jgi:hypothetical protein
MEHRAYPALSKEEEVDKRVEREKTWVGPLVSRAPLSKFA